MKRLPTVTELLPPINFFISEAELDQLAADGHENHALLEAHETQGVNQEVREEKFEYLCSLDQFLEEHGHFLGPTVLNETRLESKLGYTGKPDRFMENGNLDLKRSPGDKKYRALQMAGYNILRREHGYGDTKNWWVFWFDREKRKHVAVNVFNPLAEATFLALLQKYKIQKTIDAYMRVA